MSYLMRSIWFLFFIALIVSCDRKNEINFQVDFAAFLSKHDMKWDRLPTQWEEAPFMGNGVHGLMTYVADDQNYIQLDVGNSFVQDHRNPYLPSRMHRTPRLPIGFFKIIPKGKIIDCKLRLDLWNAALEGSFFTDLGEIKLHAYVHATEPVIIVDVTDLEDESSTITWEGSQADSPRQQYGIKYNKASRIREDYVSNPPGTILMQDDVRIYHQPLLVGGETATGWQITEHGDSKRLIIHISHSHPENTAIDQAADVINKMVSQDPDILLGKHREWWHQFYPKSFLSIPDKKLEGFYWIQLYKLASATRANGALIDNQGPWLQETPWPGAWWNLNVQLTYWLNNVSNHAEFNHSLINTLHDNLDVLIENVPEPYRYNSAGVSRSTGQIPAGSVPTPIINEADFDQWNPEIGLLPWACHNLWLHYRHTMDQKVLRDKLFPILKRATNYYLHFVEKDSLGKYHLPYTRSPEYATARDCNFDLALLKWSCQTLLEADRLLKLDDPLAEKWKDIFENITDFPENSDEGFLIGKDAPYSSSHRHYSHLLMIYPLYLVNVDQPEGKKRIQRSISHWHSFPDKLRGYSYTGAASMYAAINEGDSALTYLDKLFGEWLLPNTLYRESGPVIETPLSGGQAIVDMLLQSWGGKIRIFPAVPSKWKDVSFHKMLAEGGFEVSASRKGGKTQFIQIKSLAGEPCMVQVDLEQPLVVKGESKWKHKWTSSHVLKIDLPKGAEVLIYPKDYNGNFTIREIESEDKNVHFGLIDQ